MGRGERLVIEWDTQERRSSQIFIFIDQDRDESSIVDEEQTVPIEDVVSPREIP